MLVKCGVKMLRIMIKAIVEPTDLYQSTVKSLYLSENIGKYLVEFA